MPANLSFLSSSEQETIKFAQHYAKQLNPGAVVILEGTLGAGKTTFVKALISTYLGIADHLIVSPTFTYLNIYEGLDQRVHHFDLYRLQSSHEFIEKGFMDFLTAGHLCMVEWPDRIQKLLPQAYVRIEINILDFNLREINIKTIA